MVAYQVNYRHLGKLCAAYFAQYAEAEKFGASFEWFEIKPIVVKM